MKLYKTTDPQAQPSLVMMVYGHGGVGKTTFAATAPKPVMADCENGAKYLGLRGIEMDIAQIQAWGDMREFLNISQNYETIVIDPIGELMEKLQQYMIAQGDRKLVQNDGSPTMAGWGWLKKTLRDYVKVLRSSGKHVLLVAHVAEGKDEDRVLKRPQVATKLSDELVNMVDVVGYMTAVQDGETEKRVIIVDPHSDKYIAKDRTGQLGRIIEPDFSKIIKACAGTEKFAWSKKTAQKPATGAVQQEQETQDTAKQKPKTNPKVMQYLDEINKAVESTVNTGLIPGKLNLIRKKIERDQLSDEDMQDLIAIIEENISSIEASKSKPEQAQAKEESEEEVHAGAIDENLEVDEKKNEAVKKAKKNLNKAKKGGDSDGK